MKRITRRLHTPRPSEDDDDPAALPIQRVPSTRRRSVRASPSYRSSRRISARPSVQRLSSARISRATSAASPPGFTPSSQSSSVLLGAIGSAALENDSSYSTESELEEQPITMRSPRQERIRAAAPLPTSRPPLVVTRVPSRDSVAELIKEISGRLEEGRFSRDTMSSAWDFSLNDYCAAFPAPPTPGAAPKAMWTPAIEDQTLDNRSSSSSMGSIVTTPAAPSSRPLALRAPLSNPALGSSNAELKLEMTLRASASCDNWSTWSSPTPVTKNPASTRVVTRPNTCESQVIVTPAEKHRSITPTTQWEDESSVKSSEPPSPPYPITPPFVRPGSVDPLSQARRKTRVVCGLVLDSFNDEEFADELADGPIDHFNQDDAQAFHSRRSSNKSSLLSSSTHPRLHTHAPSTSTISNYNSYSLNSPSDDGESVNVGVALTTEYRELATPSPISISEQEDMRLTLYARRKGRQQESVALNPPLRVNPPSRPSNVQQNPPIQQLSRSSSRGYAQNVLETVRETPQSPQSPKSPKTVPPKRKSFFRYPFGSKRSAGSLKLAHRPTEGQGAPPLASPRAKEPPMSAKANAIGFFSQEPAVGGRQPIVPSAVAPVPSHAHRYLNQTSRFISFSRPSSSRGKSAVAPA